MSWNLKGSFVETCSCELMCPCKLTLDHGATYDFWRATLAFDIREDEVDGIGVRGPRPQPGARAGLLLVRTNLLRQAAHIVR